MGKVFDWWGHSWWQKGRSSSSGGSRWMKWCSLQSVKHSVEWSGKVGQTNTVKYCNIFYYIYIQNCCIDYFLINKQHEKIFSAWFIFVQADASQYFTVNAAHCTFRWKSTVSSVFLHHWLPVQMSVRAAADAVRTHQASNGGVLVKRFTATALIRGRSPSDVHCSCELVQ